MDIKENQNKVLWLRFPKKLINVFAFWIYKLKITKVCIVVVT